MSSIGYRLLNVGIHKLKWRVLNIHVYNNVIGSILKMFLLSYINYICHLFREKATSTLAVFHADPLSRANWNFEIEVFSGGRKTELPREKPSEQGKNEQQPQPT